MRMRLDQNKDACCFDYGYMHRCLHEARDLNSRSFVNQFVYGRLIDLRAKSKARFDSLYVSALY